MIKLSFIIIIIVFFYSQGVQPAVVKQQYDPDRVWEFENHWRSELFNCKPWGQCKIKQINKIIILLNCKFRLFVLLLWLLYGMQIIKTFRRTSNYWLFTLRISIFSYKIANSKTHWSTLIWLWKVFSFHTQAFDFLGWLLRWFLCNTLLYAMCWKPIGKRTWLTRIMGYTENTKNSSKKWSF